MNILKNIQRNKTPSILLIIIASILLVFIGLYINNLMKLKQSLNHLSATTIVSGQMSDVSGKLNENIEIPASYVEYLVTSKYVDNEIYSAKLFGSNHNQKESIQLEEVDTTIIGINHSNYIKPKKDDFTFLSGKNWKFLNKKNTECIVSERYAKLNHISLGDSISLPVYQENNIDNNLKTITLLDECKFEVIGIINDTENNNFDILVSVHWMEEYVISFSKEFYYNSMNFTVKKPLSINLFKEELKKHSFHEVSYAAKSDYRGTSITIFDQIFIEKASLIEKNLDIYKIFGIPFLLLVILLNSLITFLVVRKRRIDIAIQSLLGRSKFGIKLQLFKEIMLLYSIGFFIAFLFLSLYTQISFVHLILIILLFTSINALVLILVLLFVFRFDIMHLLSKSE